jgi:hypothetical protein
MGEETFILCVQSDVGGDGDIRFSGEFILARLSFRHVNTERSEVLILEETEVNNEMCYCEI